MPVLVDTNFLISVLLANDINHTKAAQAVATLRSERRTDRRDFSIYRPTHCTAFTLLP
jgi:predicted nucleic acid-binding protein